MSRYFQNPPKLLCDDTALIVHADKGWYQPIQNGTNNFFNLLGAAAETAGFETFIVEAESLFSPAVLASKATHIMMGPKRHQGPRIFHAHPSYLHGFWYLDPKGFFWNSALTEAAFRPDQIDAASARYFFNGVAGYNIRNNRSKRPQPPTQPDLPAAAAAIFVQDIEKYKRPVHYLTTDEIIATTAQTLQGRVYVKPHPLLKPEAIDALKSLCAGYKNVVISEASIHDLITASEIIVSQNSAVGFEALLHKKPVITCALCDYHHATQVCKTPEDLARALKSAPKPVAFEKYVYWFLALNLLEPKKPEFGARAIDVLRAPQAG